MEVDITQHRKKVKHEFMELLVKIYVCHFWQIAEGNHKYYRPVTLTLVPENLAD